MTARADTTMRDGKEGREMMVSYKTYKDFVIQKVKEGCWSIQNLNGQELRRCRTMKECINRIDTQTV